MDTISAKGLASTLQIPDSFQVKCLQTKNKAIILAKKVSEFLKEHGAALFYWSSLVVSGCFYPHQFILGAVWGIFLKSIVTVTDEEQWPAANPSGGEKEPRKEEVPTFIDQRTLNKQYLGSAALMLTGSYLFGGIVTFIAGWGTSDYMADLASRHITLVAD